MLSLRHAKFEDHWRNTYRRNYDLSLVKCSFYGGVMFDGACLSLKTGINAIVGKNGVGKSNLIRIIYNSLSKDGSNRRKFLKLLSCDTVDIDLVVSDNPVNLNLSPLIDNKYEQDILCLLFDPCALIPEIQKLFQSQANLDELLDGFNSVVLEGDSLKLPNFATNTEYSKIKITNIEDEYEDYPVLPYFSVERDGAAYDSRDMGLGELSLLYFYWIIDYIQRSDRLCLLIIEEPESFIPPLLQNRICDLMALITATKGNACLISTHSEHILKKIPRSHVHVMSRVQGRVVFYSALTEFDHMNVLGLSSPKKGVLFYEDHAACLFITSLIKNSFFCIADSFYYHESGSDGDVLADLKRFPASFKDFSFIAIFDGDCREKYSENLIKIRNYVFLPTKKSPEEIIIAHIKSCDLSKIAAYINVTTDMLNTAFDIVAGLDHHDYFIEMARHLGMTFDHLFLKLCDYWVQDEDNREQVMSFLSDFESKLKHR